MHRRYVESCDEQKTVFMGRVCSCCGNPVISCVVAQSHVVEGFLILEYTSTAQANVRIAARKAVAETLREIEICKRDHTAISRKPHPDDGKTHCSMQETSIQGINDTCPNCSSAEPWMPERLSDKTLEQLDDENFPTVFQTDAEAKKWALGCVSETIKQVQEVRKSPEAVTAAQTEVRELKTAIADLEERRRSLGLQEKKAALEQERAALEAKKYDIGLLDFPGRRAYNEARRNSEYYLRKVEEEIEEAYKPLDDQLTDLRIALQKAMIIAHGCTDRVLVCREGSSRSFHPEITGDWVQALSDAQLDDAQEAESGTNHWTREQQKPARRFRLPETRFEDRTTGSILMVYFSILFILGYIWDIIRMFRKGFDPFVLLSFVLTVAMGTVDYLYLAKTNANRKKYAGVFYLLLITALLLTVSITGMVLAALDGLQTQLMLCAAATAAILLVSLLIYLKLRGVKLSKLRLFTKKTHL